MMDTISECFLQILENQILFFLTKFLVFEEWWVRIHFVLHWVVLDTSAWDLQEVHLVGSNFFRKMS